MQAALAEVLSSHRPDRGELVPILQEAQEKIGYLPPEAMAEIAKFVGLPPSTVFGVATFYAQFYLTRQGRHRIKACQGTACHVRGARRVLQAIRKRLGIGPGETTPDYEFSVERVACFGSCALAPVMVVDGKVYGRMSPQKAEQILGELA